MNYTVVTSWVYDAWLEKLKRKDRVVAVRITARVSRMETGNFGDSRSVGGKVSELRLDMGPGYRVYFTVKGLELVIVLCGGDKNSQQSDIELAKEIAKRTP